MKDLIIERDGRVARIILNRPDRLNALSKPMIDDAVAAVEAMSSDDEVGCIVVTGAGRGFCAGGDVVAMNEGQPANPSFEQRVDRQRASHRLSGALYSSPKVVIAAINGAAAGAGLSIALACDLRIASDAAKFTTAFAKVGLGGDFGLTWPLVRTLGPAKAKELMFLSDILTAGEAHELGLVNRVVAADEFANEIQVLAQKIANGPLVSYRYMKENARLAMTQDYLEMLDREAITHLRCADTDDHKEGAEAFVEKRAPIFRGH